MLLRQVPSEATWRSAWSALGNYDVNQACQCSVYKLVADVEACPVIKPRYVQVRQIGEDDRFWQGIADAVGLLAYVTCALSLHLLWHVLRFRVVGVGGFCVSEMMGILNSFLK
jgi:hypothetical protein